MATTFVAVTDVAKAQELWDLGIVEYRSDRTVYHSVRYVMTTCQPWWRPDNNPASVSLGFYGYHVEE